MWKSVEKSQVSTMPNEDEMSRDLHGFGISLCSTFLAYTLAHTCTSLVNSKTHKKESYWGLRRCQGSECC